MSGGPSRVAIAGLGAIGMELARRIERDLPGFELVAVSARDREAAAERLGAAGITAPVLPLSELADVADIVVECAPRAVFAELAESVLRAGRELIALSAGVVLTRPELVDLAREHGGQITVPTGALLGLDAVGAASEGGISSVRMVSRKPPEGLAGADHLVQRGIEAEAVAEPTLVFTGTAAEAATGFPANLNVAAALALAGAGPERTEVEVWIDPTVDKNTHTIEVSSDVADLKMTIENVPSENPRTGRITALSVINLLRKRTAPLRVGS